MAFGVQQPSDSYPYDDPSTMISRLVNAAEQSIQYFLRNLNEDGSVGSLTDVSDYCKLPNALIFCGYPKEANRVLNFVVERFMTEDGDFVTRPGLKSVKAPFSVFYSYVNQWFMQAGLKLRRFDWVFKAAEFNDLTFNPITNASVINGKYNANGGNVNDIFTSAALGTTYLYFGNLQRARAIGETLCRMIDAQPDWDNAELGFPYYLRFDDDFNFIKYIAPQKGVRTIYKVQGDRIRQPYFSIGYPVAFIGKCYQVFGDEKFMKCAEKMLDYALRINKDVRTNQWAHKLMWGASIIASINNKQKYWDLVYDIANTIMEAQDANTGLLSHVLDQSEEMSFWLPIIAMNIRQTIRKFGQIGDGPKSSKL